MRSEDREKFVKLANRRVPSAIKAIHLVGNLANKSNYYYTDSDARQTIKALKDAVAETEAKFQQKDGKNDGFELR